MNRFAALAGALSNDWRADEIMDEVIARKLLPQRARQPQEAGACFEKAGWTCMNNASAFDASIKSKG